MKIKEVIIVEGKHDEENLKKYFDCDVIITGGSALNDRTMELIKKANEIKGTIIFTDPDHAGEKIRKKIDENLKQTKHAFIKKEDCLGKRNVGIENASKEVLEKALKNIYTAGRFSSITWSEYIKSSVFLDRKLRHQVCAKLNIGQVNNKTMFKRLNMFEINIAKLNKVISEVEKWK